ncbi:hypothetical protein D3C73_185430 [compost metagenome]
MNLVNHNIELVKELKIYMLKEIEEFHKRGYIRGKKYKELVEYETKKLDERIKTMESLL